MFCEWTVMSFFPQKTDPKILWCQIDFRSFVTFFWNPSIREEGCLVLLQVSKCFVSIQIFWASPNFWLHLVPLQKLLCRHKNKFYWMQIIFLSGTKCLWLPQYVNKFLVGYKKFRPAQNILGPVKGQGISLISFKKWSY